MGRYAGSNGPICWSEWLVTGQLWCSILAGPLPPVCCRRRAVTHTLHAHTHTRRDGRPAAQASMTTTQRSAAPQKLPSAAAGMAVCVCRPGAVGTPVPVNVVGGLFVCVRVCGCIIGGRRAGAGRWTKNYRQSTSSGMGGGRRPVTSTDQSARRAVTLMAQTFGLQKQSGTWKTASLRLS